MFSKHLNTALEWGHKAYHTIKPYLPALYKVGRGLFNVWQSNARNIGYHNPNDKTVFLHNNENWRN
jgi:hypothetical protein